MAEYIEREDTLRQMRNSKADKPPYGNWDIAHDCCIDIAKNIPTADVVEVKHGEWLKHKPDPEAMKRWHDLGFAKGMSEKSVFWTCSCCKGWGTPAHKYCSHCGAKMDKKAGTENE